MINFLSSGLQQQYRTPYLAPYLANSQTTIGSFFNREWQKDGTPTPTPQWKLRLCRLIMLQPWYLFAKTTSSTSPTHVWAAVFLCASIVSWGCADAGLAKQVWIRLFELLHCERQLALLLPSLLSGGAKGTYCQEIGFPPRIQTLCHTLSPSSVKPAVSQNDMLWGRWQGLRLWTVEFVAFSCRLCHKCLIIHLVLLIGLIGALFVALVLFTSTSCICPCTYTISQKHFYYFLHCKLMLKTNKIIKKKVLNKLEYVL